MDPEYVLRCAEYLGEDMTNKIWLQHNYYGVMKKNLIKPEKIMWSRKKHYFFPKEIKEKILIVFLSLLRKEIPVEIILILLEQFYTFKDPKAIIEEAHKRYFFCIIGDQKHSYVHRLPFKIFNDYYKYPKYNLKQIFSYDNGFSLDSEIDSIYIISLNPI